MTSDCGAGFFSNLLESGYIIPTFSSTLLHCWWVLLLVSVIFRVCVIPSFRNSQECTCLFLTALKMLLTNCGGFFCLVWDLWLIVHKLSICFVHVCALHEGKLCGNSVVYKIEFPPLKTDFIVTSVFVSGINLNIGPNFTFSHLVKVCFNGSIPLKLGEGGENQN